MSENTVFLPREKYSWQTVGDWCCDNVGRNSDGWWSATTVPGGIEFSFLNENHATLFALRWL